MIERQGLLHRGETFLGVAGCAEEALLVSEIILDHEPGLRIEICAVLSQNFEVVIGGQRAVLDLSATGKCGGAHGVLVGVHERAQPLFIRLVASGVELIL